MDSVAVPRNLFVKGALRADGWLPSSREILPCNLTETGAILCFGSAFGVTPPSSSNVRGSGQKLLTDWKGQNMA
jgi:hypothetical protein